MGVLAEAIVIDKDGLCMRDGGMLGVMLCSLQQSILRGL